MAKYTTDIYVTSRTAMQLVAVDPSYTSFGIVFIGIFLFMAIGCVAFFFGRNRSRYPIPPLLWLIPFAAGAPFLVFGLISMINTQITLSINERTLSVRKTLMSMSVSSQVYPLAEVRLIKVGVGDVCRFLYVSLLDRPAEDLTGCTDRTGYSEVAEEMNSFLEANRR